MDDLNGTQKVFGGACFVEDRPNSKIPRLTASGYICVVGQKDNLRVGARGKQPSSGFESAHLRHGNVQNDDVRAPALNSILDPVAVVERSDNVARRREKLSDSRSKVRAVVNEEHVVCGHRKTFDWSPRSGELLDS